MDGMKRRPRTGVREWEGERVKGDKCHRGDVRCELNLWLLTLGTGKSEEGLMIWNKGEEQVSMGQTAVITDRRTASLYLLCLQNRNTALSDSSGER